MILQDLKNKAESVIVEINAALDDLSRNDERQKQLDELDQRLYQKNIILENKKKEFALKVEDLDKRQAFMDKKDLELTQREKEVEKIKEMRVQLIADQEKLKDDKQLTLKLTAQYEEKLKKTELLDQREKELNHREELLRKESLIDLARKENLDKRQIENEGEAKRLQRIAEKLEQRQ